MKLKTLSASALQKWLHCEAGWASRYHNGTDMRTPELSGSSGSLGTVCHNVLEDYLNHDVFHEDPTAQRKWLKEAFFGHYYLLFNDSDRFKEGEKMLLDWHARQDWSGFEVLETEVKHEYFLQTSIGEVPFTFIFDRLDRKDDGSIRVVDYKSWIMPVQPEDIKSKPQFKLYAAMALLLYPDAPRVWVVADQLRYDSVGASFSKAECEEILGWLMIKAEEIINTETPSETINEDCRYCVRRHECKTLQLHAQFTGPLSLDNIPDLAKQRYEVDSAWKALKMIKDDIDAALIAHAEETEQTTFAGDDNVSVKLSVRRKNVGDPVMIARALGEHSKVYSERYGEMNGPSIQKALKDPANPIPEDVMAAASDTVRVEYSNPYVTTKKALT